MPAYETPMTRIGGQIRSAIVVGGIVWLLTACSGKAPLPPSATVVDVTMTEYRFNVRSSAPTGRAVFRVSNAGRLDHNLTLERLPSDFPPINVQLHSAIRRGAPAVAIMPTLHAGGTATFAVDLVPGRYALLSSVKDDTGVPDALKGMNAEIRVR